jgi:hypothetical protein
MSSLPVGTISALCSGAEAKVNLSNSTVSILDAKFDVFTRIERENGRSGNMGEVTSTLCEVLWWSVVCYWGAV